MDMFKSYYGHINPYTAKINQAQPAVGDYTSEFLKKKLFFLFKKKKNSLSFCGVFLFAL